MPRGRVIAGRFGTSADALATAHGYPVVNTAASVVVLTTSRLTVAAYVNQFVNAFGHMYAVRYNFNGLPVRVKDDAGNGGYGTATIATLPTGYFKLITAKSNLSSFVKVNTDSQGTGIAADFDGDYSFGTVALGAAYATLTSTKANIIPSTATAQAVSGTSTGGIGRFQDVFGLSTSNATATAILDSTGGTAQGAGTAAATLATIVTGATVTPNFQNAYSTLIKELNDLIGNSIQTVQIDGSSSAVSVILNVLVDDADQDGGGDNQIAGDLLVTGYLEMMYILV